MLTTDGRLCPGPSLDGCLRCFPACSGADFVMRDLQMRDMLADFARILMPSEFARGRYLAAGWPARQLRVMANGIPPCRPRRIAPAARPPRPLRFLRPCQPLQGQTVLLAPPANYSSGGWRIASPCMAGRLPVQAVHDDLRPAWTLRQPRPTPRPLRGRRSAGVDGAGGLGRGPLDLVGERAAGDPGSLPAPPPGDLRRDRRHGRDGARRRRRAACPGQAIPPASPRSCDRRSRPTALWDTAGREDPPAADDQAAAGATSTSMEASWAHAPRDEPAARETQTC